MRLLTRALPGAAAALVLGLALLVAPTAALASHSQVAILQEDINLLANPTRTLATLRDLGVGMVRLSVRWNTIAPAPDAARMPRRFNPADPAAYPPGNWAPYDAIVRDAQDYGIAIDFSVTSPAPRWATGPGAPPDAPTGVWKPSAAAYGQFVQALAIRYSGTYHGLSGTSPTSDPTSALRPTRTRPCSAPLRSTGASSMRPGQRWSARTTRRTRRSSATSTPAG
jgi:hypothetical protein